MATVDFTLDELKKLIEDSVRSSEERTRNYVASEFVAVRALIEKSELNVTTTVLHTFEDYDRKISKLEKLTRQHSADIAELKLQQGS